MPNRHARKRNLQTGKKGTLAGTADNREIRTLASEETRIFVKVLALTWRLRPLGQVARFFELSETRSSLVSRSAQTSGEDES